MKQLHRLVMASRRSVLVFGIVIFAGLLFMPIFGLQGALTTGEILSLSWDILCVIVWFIILWWPMGES